MRLQRNIFWTTLAICLISLFLFIAFKTFWISCDSTQIFSNIAISLFGSSLLVFIPARITFYKNRKDAKRKILSELSKIENLVNDVQFHTLFLKDINGKYNLDFSFETMQYDNNLDFHIYNIKKDNYILAREKVEKVYKLIKLLDDYDYSFFNDYLDDYVSLFHNEKYVSRLSNCYYKIVGNFMIRNFEIPYGYGSRQYDCGNASIGQFFDIWFKDYLYQLEPIFDKLKTLRTIFLILKLQFYKKAYIITLNSNTRDKKLELKKLIVDFHNEYKIKSSRRINCLIKKIK